MRDAQDLTYGAVAAGHHRPLATAFGEVEVTRLPTAAAQHPLTAAVTRARQADQPRRHDDHGALDRGGPWVVAKPRSLRGGKRQSPTRSNWPARIVDWRSTKTLQQVTAVCEAVRADEARLRQAVKAARTRGRSWNQIGVGLGVSRQAARQRFTDQAYA
jgi:hypothetical protein